jgi:ATP-dependent helicase HrpA
MVDESAPTATRRELLDLLSETLLRDDKKLRRQIDRAMSVVDQSARDIALTQLREQIDTARHRFRSRAAAWPTITYPVDLPVSQRREDLLAAIRDHQVVVVAGETGSGKTTQLPKICLELGRGRRGFIGHTQPRRIAARAVSERVAQEIGSQVGAQVGFKVRFNDQVTEQSLIKVMTDGILLAEIQSDRLLTQYDTLIIDEAHERSLNIDFILGYLKQLLPKRPDLKVIITSATIDVDRFSEHFGGAPIIEVSGRT